MRIYLDNCCYNRPYDDQSQIRISSENNDYTKWRRELFGDASVEEINKEAVAYAQNNEFRPKRDLIAT